MSAAGESVTNDAAEDFICAIQSERHKGYGFVPLIGAGLSAPSGVPLTHEVAAYVKRCIAMALGMAGNLHRPWNPRTDQWPPFIDSHHLEPPDWQGRIRDELANRKGDGDRPYQIRDDELWVFRQAHGAMEEWRSSLQFLSQLTRITSTRKVGQLEETVELASLDAPRMEIIDECFREALRGKGPGLGHRMLAMLAGALRADLLLTTNFDDLLERGFAVSRNSLDVCEVQLRGHLPQWASISETRTLIKLHGNRQMLRADYSLDVPPSEIDRRCFLEYLRGQRDCSDSPPKEGLDFCNHLLIIGHSLSERRTRGLIEHAWRYLDKNFRVFWMCHSSKDVDRARLFTQAASKVSGELGSVILRYPDPGLFLLHLYQRLRRNLPAHAGLFPSPSRLPFPPLESAHAPVTSEQQRHSIHVENFKSSIRAVLRQFSDGRRFCVATSGPDVHGVSTACAQLFRQLEANKSEPRTCLWLDMNDISSADNLFETLLEAAYFRLGLEHWTPCYVASDPERPRVREIRRLLSSMTNPWVVFLNARETPGANTGRHRSDHGWLDLERSEKAGTDGSACADDFVRLIDELCKQGPAISVVLLCRELQETSSLAKALQREGLDRYVVTLQGRSTDLDSEHVAAKAIRWTQEDSQNVAARQRFLHALILMQRPRPLATIWSTAVAVPGAPVVEDEVLIQWLKDLEQRGLVRRKAGGFIWIHCRCRQELRQILRGGKATALDAAHETLLERWDPGRQEPHIHRQLADWYGKVLDSSPTPPAVFEVVYHLCRAAASELKRERNETALRWALENVAAACAVLKTHGFLIQTRGYSRESCRRLDHIRDTLCSSILPTDEKKSTAASEVALRRKVLRLRIVCTEIMRAVAREVGEDSKTYRRHREWAALQLSLSVDGTEDPDQLINQKDFSRRLSRQMPQHAQGWVQWLRWWRWSGMLAIASRSFTKAERALRRGLLYATKAKLEECGDHLPEFNWSCLPECKMPDPWQESGLQSLRVETLRIAEQYISLELLIDSMRDRHSALGLADDPTQHAAPSVKLQDIEAHIESAQQLVAIIRENDDSPGSHHTVTAVWCQSRLLLHLSSCKIRHVRRRDEDTHQVPQTAMGILGDAESCLRVADPQRHRSDLALVDLYRGEARLRLAESRLLEDGNVLAGDSLLDRCRTLEAWRPAGSDRERRRSLMLEFPWLGTPSKNLGHMQALVGDALRFFARAEPVLRERRRNVWWTTWFFERKLRAIALSVWLSAFDRKGTIPFLGFEAAAYGVETAADALLDIGTRMIRVDAYRLATIVEAYMSCTKALQIRLLADERLCDSSIYRERLRSMTENLTEALANLQTVRKSRIAAGAAKGESAVKGAEMDHEVAEVIEGIYERCHAVATEHLRPDY